MTTKATNYINHIFLLLDASSSMHGLTDKVIQVADEWVKHLAEKSRERSEETRISVYTFADTAVCRIWDTDVLRLPSIKEYYEPDGWTALVDAVHLSLNDADLITEKYGRHDFLFYAVTDGVENRSRGTGDRIAWGRVPKYELARQLRERFTKAGIGRAGSNRSIGVLVPSEAGYREAIEFGFPAGNIGVWDATTEAGLKKAMTMMKTSTDSYMTARTTKGAGSTSLFVGANVDAKAIKAADLKPLPTENRKFVLVTKSRSTEDLFFEKPINRVTKKRLVADTAWHIEIKSFVDAAYPPYRVGMAFYELVKSEKVAADKRIAVVENNTKQVYVGAGARQLLGLPNGDCRVKPTLNPDYKIFVESTSLNRHLRIGTEVLLLTK